MTFHPILIFSLLPISVTPMANKSLLTLTVPSIYILPPLSLFIYIVDPTPDYLQQLTLAIFSIGALLLS
jgi:hypothetical protein